MKTALKYLLINILSIFLVTNITAQDTLTTIPFDMGRCIRLSWDGEERLIRNRTALDSLIRNGASRERCIELLKEVDFDAYSLLGINLNTGWCRRPEGLAYTTTKIAAEQKYIFKIRYNTPIGVCRALSSYDLWVKVPALPEGYEVEIIIDPQKPKEN